LKLTVLQNENRIPQFGRTLHDLTKDEGYGMTPSSTGTELGMKLLVEAMKKQLDHTLPPAIGWHKRNQDRGMKYVGQTGGRIADH
jgi:hypothetical protein